VVIGVIPQYSALRDRTDTRVDEIPANVGLRALLNRVLIVVALTEGPTTLMMISAPDQGVIRGSWTWSLDQVLEINPTFSPLISTLYFKLFNLDLTSFLFFTCFAFGPHLIADRYVGRALS